MLVYINDDKLVKVESIMKNSSKTSDMKTTRENKMLPKKQIKFFNNLPARDYPKLPFYAFSICNFWNRFCTVTDFLTDSQKHYLLIKMHLNQSLKGTFLSLGKYISLTFLLLCQTTHWWPPIFRSFMQLIFNNLY